MLIELSYLPERSQDLISKRLASFDELEQELNRLTEAGAKLHSIAVLEPAE
jgi:hypothetical protein